MIGSEDTSAVHTPSVQLCSGGVEFLQCSTFLLLQIQRYYSPEVTEHWLLPCPQKQGLVTFSMLGSFLVNPISGETVFVHLIIYRFLDLEYTQTI